MQVAAIAFVISIGTGVYAALGGAAAWRHESNDASYALTGMYDLRVRAADGASTARGDLLDVLERMSDPTVVTCAEERLVVATQVDASTDDATILVPGRLVGLDLTDSGPHLTVPWIRAGRPLTLDDDARDRALLEFNFARFHDLTIADGVIVSGGTSIDIVGVGLAPEYFMVTTDEGGFFGEANFATLFVSLDTAGRLGGTPGAVNDLVLTLRDDADVEALRIEVQALVDEALPQLGATVMTADEDETHRLLYDDIEGDRRIDQVFALIVLAGAAFGAFNLASRMVEAQRRELGIAMALGAAPRHVAARPLLVGAEIAVLGALLGVGMGVVVMWSTRPVYLDLLPLPVWHMPFQWGTFAQGAVLGVTIPLLATAWPVMRAVRMTPVEAITTVHRRQRHGLAPLLRHLRWPRSAFRRMPLGNVLRNPRRTLLTALGIGAAISTLVTVLGLLDSFERTMSVNTTEVLGDHPDRVQVSLDTVHSIDDPVFVALANDTTVAVVEPVFRIGGRMRHEGTEIDVLVEALDLRSELWTPTIIAGDTEDPGLVLSSTAAADLGVDIGDSVQLQIPRPTGTGFELATFEIPVVALHPNPFRAFTYIDRTTLGALGAADLVNHAYVLPSGDAADTQRALFGIPGVTSVQRVAVAGEVLSDSLDSFTGIFRVVEAFILLLALLIAYNTTSINADERARERATMFAFGLPVRRVVGQEIMEGLLHGLLGTAVGLVVGRLLMSWIVDSVISTTMPDVGMVLVLTPTSVATTIVMGVFAVGLAPLLTIRRLRRMNLPGTLRVVE